MANLMAIATSRPRLERPSSIEEAVLLLRDLGEEGDVLAGATWVMRAPSRGERMRSTYVALSAIEGLTWIERGDPTVIGALATHADLETLDDSTGSLGAVSEAARRSAFPAVRNVATVGGNICARGFAEADLVPALLASEAEVSTASFEGNAVAPLPEFLESRERRPVGEIVTKVSIPVVANRHSWFERLTVRGGGEYAVASLAISVDLDTDRVSTARIAFGSVEGLARRWELAERFLTGLVLEEACIDPMPSGLTDDIDARDGLDAPGWYRSQVLPVLLRRAMSRIAEDLS
jgi:aerobic carbon-monoxide dehydrogenase medium subunit